MHANANPLTDVAAPSASALQNELAYMSGVDANGNIAPDYYWYDFSGVDNFAHKWGAPYAGSGGGVITYSFDAGAQWIAGEQGIIQAGLALWSAVANIQFVQVPYSDSDPSQILFHYWDYGPYATATAYAASGNDPAPGQPVLGVTTAAETTFNPPQIGITRLDSFTQFGGYGVDTVIHEEGHLLGLGHAGPYNETIDPATQQLGPFDTRQWSLMSYINPSDATAAYAASYPVPGTDWGLDANGYQRVPTTWMPLDILAAQRLYGLPSATPLSGGQVFGFHCNVAQPIEPFFDFTINTAPVVTLWDEGGGNTLDVSGFAQAAVIDLRQGGFSSVDGMTNNIAIAYGTSIDTAIGGPGDTTFVLNAESDSIVGGGGWDQADFVASFANYTDTYAGGRRVVSAGNAADTLSGIGVLAFLGSNDTISSAAGGALLVGGRDEVFLAPVASYVQLGGADTVVTSSGAPSLYASGAAGGNLVFGEGDTGLFYQGGATADTIVANHATIAGGSAGLLVFGQVPGSTIDYQGGSGAATVVAGAGSETAQGGGAGALLVGGASGGDLLQGGAGPAILFGEGNGDQLTLSNAARNFAILGGGAETLQAAAATGTEIVYDGSGPDVVVGGGGLNIVAAGQGNATLTCGGGTNLFLFINGLAGGSDVVSNWGVGSDWVQLLGYGANADQAMAATATHQGGSTVMTLPDGTHVTFLNAPSVSVAQFF